MKKLVFFNGIKTAEDAKKLYRELCFKHHPDKGGNTATMQAINSEYEIVWERVKNIHTNKEGEQYDTTGTERATQETAQQFMDALKNIIHLQDITIEIIGTWVWVSGNTFQYKEILANSGYTYSGTKKMWYYTGDKNNASKHRGRYTAEQLRNKWGCEKVDTKPLGQLTA